jgi:hypothetical protein
MKENVFNRANTAPILRGISKTTGAVARHNSTRIPKLNLPIPAKPRQPLEFSRNKFNAKAQKYKDARISNPFIPLRLPTFASLR